MKPRSLAIHCIASLDANTMSLFEACLISLLNYAGH